MRNWARSVSVGVCATVLVMTHAGASVLGQEAPSSVPLLGPGVYERPFQTEAGPTIAYAISVPRGYSESGRVPLVLALHFGVGGGPGRGAGKSLVRLLVGPALADLGAVIIAPDSLGGSWNTPENERAVMNLLKEALKAYHVDPRKVAVTGFSMGGAGTWHFAARFPETFSAAIPVAGRPPADAGRWRMPVFAVHSTRDEVVPIGPASSRIAELKGMGVNAQIVVLETPSHFQTNLFADGLKQAVPWLKKLWSE